GYGEATPMEFVTPVRDLAVRAASYAMPSAIADGMDFFDVHEKAGAAVERARAGEGPTLLECKTYRYYGHYVGDPLTYRTKEEAETWRQRDPLAGFAERTVREGLVEPGNLHRLDAEVAAEVEEAERAARERPEPGAALTGLRPVAELMFIDFIGVCLDPLLNQAAKLRYMFGGKARVPLTVRTSTGAGLRSAAQHSQSLYWMTTGIPGLKTVIPSNP